MLQSGATQPCTRLSESVTEPTQAACSSRQLSWGGRKGIFSYHHHVVVRHSANAEWLVEGTWLKHRGSFRDGPRCGDLDW